MKRALEDSTPLKLGIEIPDVQMRLPLPTLPRVLSIDEQGQETTVANPTPLDVQNASNKRVYREHEWGKNVLRDEAQPEDPLEHLEEEDKQMILFMSYAKSEMAQLGQFANEVAEGKLLQLDYVPPTLPLEHEERMFRAARYDLRKAALGKAASSLKQAASRFRKAIPQDKGYFAELRQLRKSWTLQIVGGAKVLREKKRKKRKTSDFFFFFFQVYGCFERCLRGSVWRSVSRLERASAAFRSDRFGASGCSSFVASSLVCERLLRLAVRSRERRRGARRGAGAHDAGRAAAKRAIESAVQFVALQFCCRLVAAVCFGARRGQHAERESICKGLGRRASGAGLGTAQAPAGFVG